MERIKIIKTTEELKQIINELQDGVVLDVSIQGGIEDVSERDKK